MSQLSDPISDLLTRLRNSVAARLPEALAPYSRIKSEIVAILKREGYIDEFAIDTSNKFPMLRVKNRYQKGVAAISGVVRVSRPGLRRYVPANKIPIVLGGLGVAIISTSKGVVSGRDAKRMNVGGELIALIW